LGDSEFIEYKAKQIKKEYASLLGNPLYIRQKEMIALVNDMALSTNVQKDKKIQDRILHVLSVSDTKTDTESDVIRYSDWLKGKLSLKR
jgi:hypothetical protein